MKAFVPTILTRCCDCGLGTITAGEWYMVKPEVWEQAWRGRRQPWQILVPGQMVLCVGCLENRLGRTLCADDFTDAAVNYPYRPDVYESRVSDRLRDRLTATESRPLDTGLNLPPLIDWRKCKRGRPKVIRKRGRPKGSKNKPKVATATIEA
jgi:hypothetical protein